MDEVENQSRLHGLEDALLKRAFAVDQGDESLVTIGIAAQDLLTDFLDHNGLAFGEAAQTRLCSGLGADCLSVDLAPAGNRLSMII